MQGSPFFLYPVPFSLCAWYNGGLPPFQCVWKKKIQKFEVMIFFKSYLQLIYVIFYYKGFFWRSRKARGGGDMGALLFLSLYCTSGTVFCKPLCNEL